jgi:hypothetical protein
MVGIGLKPRHTKGFIDLTPQSGLKHKICEDVRYYFGQFLGGGDFGRKEFGRITLFTQTGLWKNTFQQIWTLVERTLVEWTLVESDFGRTGLW